MSRKLWAIALAVWLALWGLFAVSNVRFAAQDVLLGFLALAAAVLLLLDR